MTTQDLPNFIVVKQTKSVGISIILTLLFGPIGLFYASVTGGFVMTLTPLVFFILLIVGVAGGISPLIATSIWLLILFGLTYWIICIIWGATAVNNYNNRLISDAKRQQFLSAVPQPKREFIPETVATFQSYRPFQTNIENSTLADWRKENPHKSINDYYQKFGNTSTPTSSNTSMTTSTHQTEIKKLNQTWIWPTVTIGMIVILLFLMYDKQTTSLKFSKLPGVSDSHSKDIEEIKNKIERTYFGLVNGAYASNGIQGLGTDDLPFYNQNISTLSIMIIMPLATMSGELKIEPKNISIENITNDSAIVKYDLVMTSKQKDTKSPITMTVKKIGGLWKLDAEKFLPHNFKSSPLINEKPIINRLKN